MELDDGRRPLESSVFHLRDLVVAEVAVEEEAEEEEEEDGVWQVSRVSSGKTVGRRSAGGFAYIFFSWERLLKTPFDSRVVISLLLRRLEGEKLNRRPQSFDSPLNKF